MSVAHFSTRELATFVAISSARCQAGTLGELAEIAEMMSRSNSAAYYAQYGDHAEPSTADDIEAEALRLLAADDLAGHFGPLLYNCVTNSGTLYFGDLPADATQTAIGQQVAHWRKLEADARAWQEARGRELTRAEENAVAFNDVGRLPMKSAEQLRQLMGDGALIVAEYRVNESDSHSDYWGHRGARTVVIGVRKGKRESFPTLRKAAAAFPPTADYGPGKDDYKARVVFASAHFWNGAHYYEGQNSPWHNDLGHGRQFTTLEETLAFCVAAGPPHDVGSGDGSGQVARFRWTVGRESIEHRENWSMGGGNYLGHSRHGGWVVKSTTWISGPLECWKL